MKNKQVIHRDLLDSLVVTDNSIFLLNVEQVIFYPKNYDELYRQMYDTFRQQVGDFILERE